MRKKAKTRTAAYTLHIDALPIPFVRETASTRPHHVVSMSRQPRFSLPKLSLPRFSFLWLRGALEYVAFSAVVFVAIYGVLNYQTLWMNAEHYWNVWNGFESPLQAVAQEKPPEPERLVASGAMASEKDFVQTGSSMLNGSEQDTIAFGQGGAASTLSVPPLNLEVYPPDTRLIIPRINQNVPVIGVKNESLVARDWDKLEKDIQEALRSGVIHYPGTALPGEGGNVVITGHSSYYAWDAGRFKDVFGLLHDVRVGDRIVMFFSQKKFVYEVTDIKVVLPKDVDVLKPSSQEQLTLITCTPLGTNLKRLILTARLVSQSL